MKMVSGNAVNGNGNNGREKKRAGLGGGREANQGVKKKVDVESCLPFACFLALWISTSLPSLAPISV